jgi:hypothetical protein
LLSRQAHALVKGLRLQGKLLLVLLPELGGVILVLLRLQSS